MTINKQNKLKAIAEVFLKEETDYLKLSEAITQYKSLLLELTNLNLEDSEARKNLEFNNGIAIGTTWAAMCLDDMMRTKIFIKGIFEAVHQLSQNKDKPIHILYAGTGPFATLILPLFAYYSPQELQFTLIEINPISFNFLKKVITKLGADDYIRKYEMVDATKYQIPKNTEIDLVISETMLRALLKEQQVPIVINLMQQLPDSTLLIPAAINLSLVYYKNTTEEHKVKKLGNLFDFNSDAARRCTQDEDGNLQFPKYTFSLPRENRDKYHSLSILTDIQVFGNNRITHNQSGLTTPNKIKDIEELEGYQFVDMQYKVENLPNFETTFY